MTEIICAEGIVLRRRDFQESSRIAVVYTREAGKVQLLARAARRPRNKYGAALEPLSRGEFVFYWREAKDLFTLSEVSARLPPRRLRDDPVTVLYGLALAEALDKLTGEGDADENLFELFASSLDALAEGGPPGTLLAQFLLRLAHGIGLKPNLDKCSGCGRERPAEGVVFVPKDGSVVCRECEPTGGDKIILAPATYNFVNTLLSLPPSHAGRVRATPELVEQTLTFIRAHLHFQAGLEIKSLTLAAFP